MIDPAALDIFLKDTRIGTIARLGNDRSIFTFDDAYAANGERPTLSLSYLDQYGELISAPRALKMSAVYWSVRVSAVSTSFVRLSTTLAGATPS